MADKIPECFWRLASAGTAKSKASWAHTQTAEFCRKRTIISVDEDESLVIFWALEDYIEKHRSECGYRPHFGDERRSIYCHSCGAKMDGGEDDAAD